MKKKTTCVFLFQKYSKFWSILPGHFIKHKPLISDEWIQALPEQTRKPNSGFFFRLPKPIPNFKPRLSFDGRASPNDIDRISPNMGKTLALVPIGHEPVTVFPPFSVHRRITILISCNVMLLPNECPGLCQNRPGHSLGKNIKLHEMKMELLGEY